jgi:UTP--glucose-1-phosphate uridylyltransferase
MKIKKAVITAAARGNRIYPVADSVHKSMLPVIDRDGIHKPIIQIIAEEAFTSGIEEICIVCAPGDEVHYLKHLKKTGDAIKFAPLSDAERELQGASVKRMIENISFVVQEEPLGYGDAVFKSRKFTGDEPFLLLSGDYLYISYLKNRSCASQLIELAETENCSVSAVNPTPEYLISKYGTLTGKSILNRQGAYQVEKIIEKPSVTEAELELQTPGLKGGYYLCFFGMSVFTPILHSLLEEYINNNSGKQILLTPVLQKLAGMEKYLALEIRGNRYDTSKKLGLMQAQLALGLSSNMKEEIMGMIIETMGEEIRRGDG